MRPRAFNGQPIVDVEMIPISPTVQFTGDDDFVVEIRVKQQFTQQPDMANSESQRIVFDAMVGQVRMQLLLSNDGHTLNATRDLVNAAAWTMPVDSSAGTNPVQVQFSKNHADMADFTIQKLLLDVNGRAKAEDCNMSVVQRFKVTACETKISDLQ